MFLEKVRVARTSVYDTKSDRQRFNQHYNLLPYVMFILTGTLMFHDESKV